MVSLTVSGVSYDFPEPGDSGWGQDVTNWATAISSATLQKAGGIFTLLADVDFGAGFGLKPPYVKTRTANPATTGLLRLARTDVLAWRNQANGANLELGVNSSNQLTYMGSPLGTASYTFGDTATIDLTTSGVDITADVIAGSLTNTHVNASAAIALSKLAAVTASRALVSDGSGFVSASSVTGTELGYVSGVTSALQTQLNAKITAGAAAIVNADVHATAAIALSKLAAVTASRALVSDGSGFVSASAVTATELGYVSGVTSAIQTQLDSKVSGGGLTASRAVATDGSGNLVASATTATELGYVSGVTSAIQTQLNGKLTTGTAALVNADVHAAAAIALSKLAATTASRALVSDGSGFVSASSVTATELGYVSGVTSAIQTQLNAVVANGGLVPLAFYAPSAAASVDVNGQISSTYEYYLGFFVFTVGTDDVELFVRTDENGGASFEAGASDYDWSAFVANSSAASVTEGDTADSEIRIVGQSSAGAAIGNATGEGVTGVFLLSRGSAATDPKVVCLSEWRNANGGVRIQISGGERISAAAINAIQIIPESGTITGFVAFFGVKTA